ncbi:hypothetical protein NGR_b01490 (plasmid) [Sinorhizobium fredii NGR234]|uniref:Transmembrane protein n=1 Tax=Sinorhizobium fredii (strain NBRC 101917 / NGR234) TaxID=394 RepID=C3KN42_SINFN|nr:hypothetical protein NGR_b01490 [Sinorhizobium fredii NGR234]
MKIGSTSRSFSGSILASVSGCKGVAMTYDWDGKRTRRLQMLTSVGALAIAALLFGSAMAALQSTDTDGPAVRTALR